MVVSHASDRGASLDFQKRAARPLDTPSKVDRLLPEKGILGYELRLAADKVSQRAALGGRFRDRAHTHAETCAAAWQRRNRWVCIAGTFLIAWQLLAVSAEPRVLCLQ